MLPWDVTTHSLTLKTGVNWPDYTPRGARSGKSLQLWLARRWSGARLDRDAARRAQVLARLKQGWSPEQIAGRFRRERGTTIIARETIYRFIYAQTTRTKTGVAWRHYLPRAKWKRGWRGRRGGSPASFIHLRRPLAERPTSATDRRTPGHWEADLMLFRTYGQAVLTVQERHSRLLLAERPRGKAAAPITQALAALGLETFFCDTHAPW